MIEESRIVEAIDQSGVRKIVLLDDAFDAPAFDKKYAGKMMDYIGSENFKKAGDVIGLQPADIDKIKSAMEQTDYDSEAIARLIEQLYKRYREKRQSEFDPGGMFAEIKGQILAELDPLITLLAKCANIDVQHLGREGDLAGAKEVDIIFADYFLLDAQAALSQGSTVQNDTAVKHSYDRVVEIVGQAQAGKRPSIVLMSSQDVKEAAEGYRTMLRKGPDGEEVDLIYASSFAFMKKDELKIESTVVAVAEEAADAILDVFQTFEFGRSLHGALNAWVESARTGVAVMQKDIAKLRVKDFAYLIKFRLMEEGESLLEYLEWFFGECLLDGVARAFDGSDEAKAWEEGVSNEKAARLEGAFDGPTDKIAELYHRVRIARPRAVPPRNYKLGDLYLSKNSEGKQVISAILNPECDLILRKGKRKATKLLTVSGEMKVLKDPDASVTNFILVDDDKGKPEPFLINWNLKSLNTHITEENVPTAEKTAAHWPAPGSATTAQKHVGTLRPLYAQQLQRDVLTDLGRPALPVAPAIAMAAHCKFIVRRKGGKTIESVAVGNPGEAHCWVIQSEKPKVVFARRFVTDLIRVVKGLDENTYIQSKAKLDAEAVRGYYTKLCSKGVELGGTCYGIDVVAKEPTAGTSGDFSWLFISGVDLVAGVS